MKKIILALTVFVSMPVFSATEASSIRTSSELIERGNSVGAMMSKLGRPTASYEYVTRDVNNKIITATDFYYTINGLKYTITAHHGNIVKIVWER